MKCPFCQHANPPGTRFCAECGFSMHLKICPNPQCGKISEVGVAVCEHCGQAFPKVEAAPEAATATPAASPAQASAPEKVAGPADRDKPRTAAWPLIMVAIVAGGLPLLWANRASLPTPKPWQGGTPDAAKTEGTASAPIANIKPPVVPELVPAPTPAPTPAATQATPQAPADSAVPASAAPPSGVDQNKPTPSAGADATKQDPVTPPQTGDASKKTAKKADKAPSPRKKEPPRPCTEATAALGLCDPKRPGQ